MRLDCRCTVHPDISKRKIMAVYMMCEYVRTLQYKYRMISCRQSAIEQWSFE